MKRVLIIAHLLHASPRIPGLVKYLPEHGWEPVIVAPPSAKNRSVDCALVETGYRDALDRWRRVLHLAPGTDMRDGIIARFGAAPASSRRSMLDRLLTIAGAVVNYPDSDKGWKPYALDAADQFIRANQVAALMSSSSPVTSHVVAAVLARRHRLSWLADLRDPWSQNHNYTYGPIRRLLDRRLELKTLSEADALVTVSPPWAENLKLLHNRGEVHTITNGFDPATLNEPPAPLTPAFTITYTGSIYRGRQDPTKLFAAIRQLIDTGAVPSDKIRVRFYGPVYDWLHVEIDRYGLGDIVQQYGPVSHADALGHQRESHVLLLLDWDGPGEDGVYPGKIFEYLAARRPILATGGKRGNVVAKLLAETQAGIHASASGVDKAIVSLYKTCTAHDKVTAALGAAADRYSYREMAGKFAALLDGLTGGTG